MIAVDHQPEATLHIQRHAAEEIPSQVTALIVEIVLGKADCNMNRSLFHPQIPVFLGFETGIPVVPQYQWKYPHVPHIEHGLGGHSPLFQPWDPEQPEEVHRFVLEGSVQQRR